MTSTHRPGNGVEVLILLHDGVRVELYLLRGPHIGVLVMVVSDEAHERRADFLGHEAEDGPLYVALVEVELVQSVLLVRPAAGYSSAAREVHVRCHCKLIHKRGLARTWGIQHNRTAERK